MRRRLMSGAIVAAGAFLAAALWAQTDYTPAQIEAGAAIYSAQCVTCHGAAGDAVGGINLSTNTFRRVSTDQDLMNVIATGIPQSGMPAHNFSSAQLVGLVA